MADEITDRVRELERWKSQQETRAAVEAEQRKHMDERFDRLEREVSSGFIEIKSAFAKVIWAAAFVLMTAFANWILRGGLLNAL